MWYRDAVGFTVDQNYEREEKLMAVSLKAGDVRILLTRDDGAKGWNRAKGAGCSPGEPACSGCATPMGSG